MAKLYEIARILSGYSIHGAVEQDPEGNAFIVRPADGSCRNEIDWRSVKRISVDPRKNLHHLGAGDILFRANGKNHPAFLVTEVPKEALAIAHQHFLHVHLRDQQRWCPGFLTLLLNSERAQAYFEGNATGANQSVVKKSVLQDFELPDIPLDAQQSWVTQWHECRTKVERLEAEIERLERGFSLAFSREFDVV